LLHPAANQGILNPFITYSGRSIAQNSVIIKTGVNGSIKTFNPEGISLMDLDQHASRAQPRIAADSSNHNPHIAAILPAYNEGGRIGHLLAVLKEVDLINEIIVVDDGSQDSTSAEALEAARQDERIRVIRHDHNQGKGAAMFNGSRHTPAPIVIFLDSDLIGLAPAQVEALIQPVASGQADMSIGIFKNGSFVTDASQRVTPWLSGQRCLRRRLLTQVSPRAAAGYGVETAITIAARQGKWRVTNVPLTGVSHPTGEIHRGLIRGAANRLRMYSQILQAAWLAGAPTFKFARLTPRIRFLSIAMTILFAVTLAFNQAQALALFQLEDLAAINLEGVFRILVIDQDTTSIPDLLAAESNDQKLIDLEDLHLIDRDLPNLDLGPLKLPPIEFPALIELPVRADQPDLIQSVALSLDNAQFEGNTHRLKLRLTGEPNPAGTYSLVMVTSSGADTSYSFSPKVLGRGQKPAAVVIDLSAFEDPFLIGIALEAVLEDDTQRSGWTLILFPELIPRSPLNP
jgi:hypothetical protein